jgi:hypothetical protein
MSPSEASLRRALRDGEGERLDPDVVLSHAEAFRRARRARVGGMIAAAAVVAGVGVGAGLLVADHNDPSRPRAGGIGAGGPSRPSSSPGPSSSGYNFSSGTTGTGSATGLCPGSIPLLPFVARQQQALFSGPVATLAVCLYDGPNALPSEDVVLVGSDAQAVATSLNLAGKVPATCAAGVSTSATGSDTPLTVVIEAWYASGGVALPVVATGDDVCADVATDGGVTVHGWRYPETIAKVIAGVRDRLIPSSYPPPPTQTPSSPAPTS